MHNCKYELTVFYLYTFLTETRLLLKLSTYKLALFYVVIRFTDTYLTTLQ